MLASAVVLAGSMATGHGVASAEPTTPTEPTVTETPTDAPTKPSTEAPSPTDNDAAGEPTPDPSPSQEPEEAPAERPAKQEGNAAKADETADARSGSAGVAAEPAASLPGQPGIPQEPGEVYTEDFEHGQPSGPRLLTAYTGAPPLSMTYTAHQAWLQNCNGYVMGYANTAAPTGWTCNSSAWNSTRTIAASIGSYAEGGNGQGNHVVAAYTGSNPLLAADLVQFETANTISVTPNRFYTFSVDAGYVNCFAGGPKYKFYLVDGGTEIPAFTDPIDVCTNPDDTINGVRVGTGYADSAILFPGADLGIRMRNGYGSPNGNDGGFDNIRLLDATPQLDKSFSPARVPIGDASTLTFTITNTSDLAEKSGWGFTDELPTGLSVASPAAVGGTCTGRDVSATPGGTTVTVSGDLLARQESCTVTVDVTSAESGTYDNCAANVTDLVGINPPGCASVEFGEADYGDAPDSYGTARSAEGPRHFVVGYDETNHVSSLQLGGSTDVEADGAPGPAGTGDDDADADDDDAIVDGTSLARDTAAQTLEIALANTTGRQGHLHGWIDADGDGVFQADEHASADVPEGSSTASLQWTGLPVLPNGAQPYVRLRLTTDDLADDGGTAVDERSRGQASDGEVEDHRVPVAPVSLTCATDAAVFNTAYNGAGGRLPVGARDRVWEVGLGTATGHSSVASWTPAYVVAPVANAWAPSPHSNADWISHDPSRAHNTTGDFFYRYQFRIADEVPLDGFALPMDFYADNSVWEVYVNGVAQSGSQSSLPQNAANPYFHNGFGVGRQASTLLADGWQYGLNTIIVHIKSANPSVEGFMAQMTPQALCNDYGDAPDSFGTDQASDGARHGVADYEADGTASLMLGESIDVEADASSGSAADGDDTAGSDDEDGLSAAPVLTAGATTASVDVAVTNTTGGPATLRGWIDANGNGTFQPTEHASVQVPHGATNATLDWSGLPALLDGSQPILRLRLTTSPLVDDTATPVDERSRGAAADGEVEDHRAIVATELPNGCGTPFVEDFGAGTGYGPALPAGQTTYVYEGAAAVNDGEYGILSALPGTAGTWWHNGQDHTPSDSDGRMMVINASFQPGQFFQRSFTGLEVGGTYDFSAWITNANSAGSPILPNVTFRVVDPASGEVLGQVDTGTIARETSLVWKRHGIRFQATTDTVRLEMINNAPGGSGNDLAIDDISLNAACEFGDAPASYGTLLADNGPVHVASGPRLGADRDGEGDGLPSTGADGDDITDADDEDGVAFNPALGYPNPTIRTGTDAVTLQPASNTLEVTASDDGFASVWVDWNRDGDFTDDGERVANAQPITAGTNTVTFSQGTNPADIRTYVRVRFSTDAASIAQPTGPAPDGEIEDYQVLVERLIVPAACTAVSEPFYAMTFRSIIDKASSPTQTGRYPNVTVVGGVPVDMVATQASGGMNAAGFFVGGDDAAWNLSSGGGTSIKFSFFRAGTTTPISVNGVWAINDMDAGEATVYNKTDVSGYALTPGSKVKVTETATQVRFDGTQSGNAEVWSRYQIWFTGRSTVQPAWSGFNNSGFTIDGDGDLSVPPSCEDYGDAPDSYKTLLASNGPRHALNMALRLGSVAEFDGDGQPTATASGDDTNRIDDEDGVASPIVMTAGEPTTVNVAATNNTGAAATLVGWLDLDGNGAFEVGERVTIPVGAGTATYPVVFRPGPETTTTAYARFRLYPGTVTDAVPTGPANAGEVEDYPVQVLRRSLQVTKTSNATADSRPGDEVTYTVTITNTGLGAYTAANPARVVDDLTAVLDDADYNGDVSATVDGSEVAEPTYSEPRVRWEGPLAGGKSVVITYTVTLTGGGDGTVRNVAWAPTTGNPGPTPDCDDRATTVPCDEHEILLPKLRISKQASRNDLPAVGGEITYTVTVRNVGPGTYSAAAPATFADDLTDVEDDADLVAGSLSASSGTPDYTAPELTWSGALARGAEATVTYTFIYNGEGDQSLVNKACVPAEEAADPQDTCRTTTTPGSGLDQAKTADPPSGTSVDAGDEITYTLRFTNTGQTPATVDTSDDLSGVLDDAALVEGPTADSGLTATLNGGQIDIEGTVPVGETLYVTYTVTVDDWADQGDNVLRNALACQPGDPTTCQPDTTEHRVRALAISKTSNATASSRPGDEVTYTITAQNVGDGDYTDADPAVVLDALADVLDDADWNDDATARVNGVDVGEVALNEPRLRWSGPLASGETVEITYTVTLAGGGDGVVRNTAFAPECDPDTPGCNPPTPECDDGVDPATGLPCDLVVSRLPKLTITKTADVAEVNAKGDEVTYTVVVKNEGPGDYTASDPAAFADDLTDVTDDATLLENTVTATVGDPAYAAPELTWTGVLAAGESSTIKYTVRYTGAGNASLVNLACGPRVEALDPDENCDTVTVEGSQLVQSKTADPADGESVGASDEITYTLTFRNEGTAPATVDTVDNLSGVLDDAELTGGPDAGAGLTPTVTGDELGITGSVPAGETRTVTYTVTVLAPGGAGDGVIANALACQPGEPPTCEPDTTEHPVRQLQINKRSNATTATRQGDTVQYTITAENVGPGEYTSDDPAVVADALSGVLDDAEWNDDATATIGGTTAGTLAFNDPRLVWTGPLASGETVTITYSVTLRAGGDGVLRNVAFAPECDPAAQGCNPPTPACDGGVDPATGLTCDVEEALLPRLTISKSVEPAQANAVGDEITYTIVVRNPGPGAYTDAAPATFTDDLSDVLDDATLVDNSVTGGASVDGDQLSWTGTLPADGAATITYKVRYTGAGNRELVNSACVPESEALAADEACDITETPGSALVQTKTADPASGSLLEAGDEITYTLTFDNSAGSAPATVDTTDDLSEVLDDAEIIDGPTAGSGLTPDLTGDQMALSGSVPAGGTRIVTYTVKVKPYADQGDHVLRNALACQPGEPAACEPEVTEHEVRHLKLTKTSDAAEVTNTGDTVTYTLTVENDGAGDYTAADPATVVDDLTDVVDDATYNGDAEATEGDVSFAEPELTWSGPIASGDSVTITYTVTVTNLGDHDLENIATVPGCDDDSCNPPAVVTLLPHVVPGKTSDPASGEDVAAGQVITYTLTWTNDGEAAGPVDATDDLSGVLDDADLTGEPVSSDPDVTAVRTGDSLRVTGTIEPGETITVVYEVTIRPDGRRGDNAAGNVLTPDAPQVTCDESGDCEPVDPPVTEHKIGELDDWKTVDPASGTTVKVKDELTYTLHFTNTGSADVEVDRDDVVTGVLDDAKLVAGPTSSDAALTASGPSNGRISVTGTLTPGQTVTVSYTVKVKPDGERGDDRIGNYLVAAGEEPPADCGPEMAGRQKADAEHSDCTDNPVSTIVAEKSVKPGSGTEVEPGDVLTYTLRFENTGQGPGEVNHVDDLSDVLDDAALVSEPTYTAPNALTAELKGNRIRITGTLAPGDVDTVSYAVEVKDADRQGNSRLANFLAPAGEESPARCPAESKSCTTNDVSNGNVDDPGDDPDGGLPDTGSPVGIGMLVAAVLLLVGGIALLVVGRRRRAGPS